MSLRLIEIVWDMVGFFELSSNRRDIWHGTGMVGVGQLRCDWNISLLKVSFHWHRSHALEMQCRARFLSQSQGAQFDVCARYAQDVAAPAYANLLVEAARRLGPSPAFYKLWPVQQVRQPWSALVTALYQELSSRQVVHTAAGAGKWLAPDNAVYVDGAVQRSVSLTLLFSHWIAQYEVLFNLGDDMRQILRSMRLTLRRDLLFSH